MSGIEQPTILLAPGAGAPSSSPWMQALARRLETFARVVLFDYPYRVEGRRAPDGQRVLVGSHRSAFERLEGDHPGNVVLVGKSMGSRMGCHVAVEAPSKPKALVCLGYPLVGQNGARRDRILVELETRILFIQGTRDTLCPLDDLETVRARMKAPNELFVVEGGDHSLGVTRKVLERRGVTRNDVDDEILGTIRRFLTGSRTTP